MLRLIVGVWKAHPARTAARSAPVRSALLAGCLRLFIPAMTSVSALAADVLKCTTLNGRTDCQWGLDEGMFPGQGRPPSTIDEALVAEWSQRWGGCRWDGAGACRDYFGRVVELSPMARPADP
jgi:hypothetical protein